MATKQSDHFLLLCKEDEEGRKEVVNSKTQTNSRSRPKPFHSSASKTSTKSKFTKQSKGKKKPVAAAADNSFHGYRKSPSFNHTEKYKGSKRYRVGRENVTILSLSKRELRSLCDLPDPIKLTSQLCSRIKSFQSSLQNSTSDIVENVVYILHKVSECLVTTEVDLLRSEEDHSESSHSQALRILGEVLSTRCSKFHLCLQVYVQRDLVNEATTKHAATVRMRRGPRVPTVVQSVYRNSHERTASVCKLFKTLLEVMPDSSWAVLPVHELAATIKKSPLLHDLQADAEAIEALYNEMQDNSKSAQLEDKKAVLPEWDHAEYREQQILPQKDEVCIPQPPNRLRPNIISGSYTDWMHYYDVQFRLLREDFIAPLRRGICDYIGGARGRELQDVKAYHEVTFSAPLFARQGVCYEISFDVSRLQRCRWEHSKRLIFGSLLCLSPDNFQSTVLFATVADRDANELRRGKLKVRFEEEGAKMLAYCKEANVQKFTMVESAAYFEASRHILCSLQTAEVATMPFTPYLIQNQCGEVGMPKYLDDIPVAKYDLKCLKGNEVNTSSDNIIRSTSNTLHGHHFFAREVESSSDDTDSSASETSSDETDSLPKQSLVSRKTLTLNFNIKDFSQWPGADEIELDQSQLHAIQMALTQEVAVIQGPPGTGKTYVGLKITEALLKNRTIWDPKKESPILVMCFTNHALDQFLEGLVQHYVGRLSETNLHWLSRAPKIIRIGGRSRNELIQSFNINKVLRDKRPVPQRTYKHMKDCERAASYCSERIKYHLKEYYLVKKCQSLKWLLYPGKLNSVDIINQNHFYQLYERVESREEHDRALELWLGTYEVCTEQVPCEVSPTNDIPDTTKGKQRRSKQKSAVNVQEMTFTETQSVIEERSGIATEATQSSEQEMPEETKELIDVQGEATIEQGARMLDDDYFQAKRFDEPDLESESHFATNQPKNELPTEQNDLSRDSNDDEIQDVNAANVDDFTHSDSESEDEEDVIQPYTHNKSASATDTGLGVFTHSDIESLSDEEDVIQGFGNFQNESAAVNLGVIMNSYIESSSDDDDEEDEEEEKVFESVSTLTQPDLENKHQRVSAGVTHENEDKYNGQSDSAALDNYTQPEVSIKDSITEPDSEHDYVKVKGAENPDDEVVRSKSHKETKVTKRQRAIKSKATVDMDIHQDTDSYPSQKLPQLQSKPSEEESTEQASSRVVTFIEVRRIKSRPDAYKISKRGHQQPPMTAEEANHVDDIHSLSHQKRWKLYNYWVSEYLKYLIELNEEKFEEYDRLCKQSMEAKKDADRYALETAEVIGMTTTGAAKYQHILHLVKPKIVVVEEAAEVLESHIVSALNAGTQHLILIGDHKQLRPKPNDYELARKYHLDISLFERLVRNNFPHATLQIQHRMRPEIAQLVKPHIYQTLINHHSVEQYDHVKGVEKNLFFIQHENPETGDANLLSHSNLHEAKFLAALCKYLLLQGYKPSQVTILVTYTGQLLKMRDHLPRDTFEGVRVCTVDNFQGEENDIILLSLVRSNDMGRIGFLFEENRVCVSLSRARMGFYCIGNFALLRRKAPIWNVIMSDMKEKGYLGDSLPLGCANHPKNKFSAQLPEDFDKNAPKGGCQEDCNYRMPCGHVCPSKCHIVDPEHENYKCQKQCIRKCPEGHSSCHLRCFQVCKPCDVVVERELPSCGHTKVMMCHEDPVFTRCQLPCTKTCDSGHPCPKKCFRDCGDCKKIVLKTIEECGHEVKLPCWIPPDHQNCTMPCDKTLTPCGHQCQQLCGKMCNPLACTVRLEKQLDCGHIVEVSCNRSSLVVICDKPCERKLNPCGHPCHNKCSQPCTQTCRIVVDSECPCGHKVRRKCFQAQNPDRYPCLQPCTKTLACGHPCTKKCSEPCTVECHYPSPNKTCPNGHKWKRKCFQTNEPGKYPCQKRCVHILSCGHPCPGRCGEDCTKYLYKCKVLAIKVLPCGHTHMAPCSVTDSSPCKTHCSYVLSCGHKCEGYCSTCSLTRIHEPCQFEVGPLKQFCGHNKGKVPCLDLQKISHSSKQKRCTAYCPHKKCSYSHDCTTPCTPCTEPCAWSCPHHQCNKLCHEVCERPQCNERCEKHLKCGHQCYGLCGEPCLTFCPECKRKDFNKHFNKDLNKSPSGFDPAKLYVQLSCEHIFMVEVMDSHARHHEENRLVAPLQCPDSKCESHTLCSSYRYGNVVKKSLKDVNAVRNDIQEHHAVLPDDIQDIKRRLETIIGQHMQDKISTQETSKMLYESLVKTGWYTSTTRIDKRVKKYRWYRYKPLPWKTEDLRKLHSQVDRTKTSQELYVLRLLMTALELQSVAFAKDLKRISLSEITYTRDVKKQLGDFLHIMFSVRKLFQSRLSAQLVSDFQSEMYRITLIVQYCLVKKFATSALPSVIEAVHFLRQCAQTNSFQVRQQEFHKFSSLLATQYQTVTISACCNKVDHIVTPPVLKGTWWKCPNGHYYCVPLTMSGGEEASCPKC